MKRTKLKILFDAGPLVNGQKSGIGHYTYQLIYALAKQYPDELELVGHYFNFLGRKQPQLPMANNLRYKSSKIIPGKVLAILRRTGLQLPFELLIKSRGDIAFFPNFVCLPTISRIKKVSAVHDLAFKDYPQYLQPANLKFLLRFVPRSLKRSSRVVTISENSKNEIVHAYNYPAGKISVIFPAVDHTVFKPQSAAAVKKVSAKFKVQKPYILCVGTIEPRKNFIGVLNAFELLPEKLKQSHALVIAGGQGWLNDEINQKFNRLAKNYSLVKTGYVDEADLPALYAGASVFAFPSFYEGFGIPPLEAMACGTPVITSNNSSLPEAAGSAALMVDAKDTKSLAKQMERVLSDKKLAESLKAKGLAQAKKFTWESSAQKLMEVFESLAS